MTIKKLKKLVIRQREALHDLDENWLRNIGESKESWLEQELLTLFEMIGNLEEK